MENENVLRVQTMTSDRIPVLKCQSQKVNQKMKEDKKSLCAILIFQDIQRKSIINLW